MKKVMILLLLAVILCGCGAQEPELKIIVPTVAATTVPETEPPQTTCPTVPETTEAATLPPIVLELTDEEQRLLLKIGMAELGHEGCPQCIALVMRTVLNRLEAGRYGKTIRGILYAQDQFTPVMDGSFESAKPNDVCYEALDMVLRGWDESQGALFYEFCEGESWHSRNLQLLTEHCNTRFYK